VTWIGSDTLSRFWLATFSFDADQFFDASVRRVNNNVGDYFATSSGLLAI
jgi:hypothetical protein